MIICRGVEQSTPLFFAVFTARKNFHKRIDLSLNCNDTFPVRRSGI